MIHNAYGETSSEKLAAENLLARKIVNEINQFGVNDRHKWLIIYLLGLELENIEDVKAVSQFVKDRKSNDLFVTKIYGVEEEEVR